MLLTTIRQNEHSLRTAGRDAIAEANRAGVPAYFMAPELGEGIIRQLPDGVLQRVRIEADGETVLETLPARR